MTALARSIAELVGFAFLGLAAFLLHPVLGFVVTGIVLILAANFGGRLETGGQRAEGAIARLVAPSREREPTWPEDLS